jgi:hypothetical protein
MKQTDDSSTPARSRRAILLAAAGAAGSTAATVLARPLDALADSGDPLILGQANVAGDQTGLEGQLFLQAPQTPPGTIALEVIGSANVGVYAHGGGTGVFGETEGVTATSGVIGGANGEVGVGVSALNPYGVGLFVLGKAKFVSRSGRAIVGAGKSFVDVDLRQKGGLSGTPLCFANLTSRRVGVHVEAVRPNDPGTGRMRIYLNGAVTANTFVAWFVLN